MQAVNSSQAGGQLNSQAGMLITLRASPQTSQADSALPSAESAVSQAGRSHASLADNTLSQAESAVSWASIPQASKVDSTLPQAMSTVSQASPADNTLSQAETMVSQAGIPQATLAVRCLARLRASQVPPNNNYQAGNTTGADNAISQPDSEASQVVSSQASASQEARSSPSPNR